MPIHAIHESRLSSLSFLLDPILLKGTCKRAPGEGVTTDASWVRTHIATALNGKRRRRTIGEICLTSSSARHSISHKTKPELDLNLQTLLSFCGGRSQRQCTSTRKYISLRIRIRGGYIHPAVTLKCVLILSALASFRSSARLAKSLFISLCTGGIKFSFGSFRPPSRTHTLGNKDASLYRAWSIR